MIRPPPRSSSTGAAAGRAHQPPGPARGAVAGGVPDAVRAAPRRAAPRRPAAGGAAPAAPRAHAPRAAKPEPREACCSLPARSWKKTLIVVSHDREFLNSVTTDIIHLHDERLHYYRGNFAQVRPALAALARAPGVLARGGGGRGERLHRFAAALRGWGLRAPLPAAAVCLLLGCMLARQQRRRCPGVSHTQVFHTQLPTSPRASILPQFEEMYEQRRREANKEFEKYQKQLKAAKKSGSKAAADKVRRPPGQAALGWRAAHARPAVAVPAAGGSRSARRHTHAAPAPDISSPQPPTAPPSSPHTHTGGEGSQGQAEAEGQVAGRRRRGGGGRRRAPPVERLHRAFCLPRAHGAAAAAAAAHRRRVRLGVLCCWAGCWVALGLVLAGRAVAAAVCTAAGSRTSPCWAPPPGLASHPPLLPASFLCSSKCPGRDDFWHACTSQHRCEEPHLPPSPPPPHSFKYPGRDDFGMRNMNIGIDMGSRVAIVGPNGAGERAAAAAVGPLAAAGRAREGRQPGRPPCAPAARGRCAATVAGAGVPRKQAGEPGGPPAAAPR